MRARPVSVHQTASIPLGRGSAAEHVVEALLRGLDRQRRHHVHGQLPIAHRLLPQPPTRRPRKAPCLCSRPTWQRPCRRPYDSAWFEKEICVTQAALWCPGWGDLAALWRACARREGVQATDRASGPSNSGRQTAAAALETFLLWSSLGCSHRCQIKGDLPCSERFFRRAGWIRDRKASPHAGAAREVAPWYFSELQRFQATTQG